MSAVPKPAAVSSASPSIMTRPSLIQRLAAAHAERAKNALRRRLRTVEAVDGATIRIDGRRLLNFASNDYLGLAQHPASALLPDS